MRFPLHLNCLASLTFALAGHAAFATCNTWTAMPAPTDYVSTNSMTVADPDGSGPLSARLIIPNAILATDGTSGGVGLWNGSTLSQFGPDSTGTVLASTQFDGRLVAAGNFGGDTVTFQVVTGDGSSWTPLGTSTGAAVGPIPVSNEIGVYALLNFGGTLIAAGAFTSIDGVAVHSIARWNGTSWQPMGNFDGTIRALAVFNNDLYAAGAFTTVDGAPASNIAYFQAGTWHAAGGGVGGDHAFLSGVHVNTLAVFNGKLFAAGSFARVGGTSAAGDGSASINIGAWDGSSWTSFGAGLDQTDPDLAPFGGVASLAVVGSSLYAGGVMNSAAGTVVDGIAAWNGSAWIAVGTSDLAATLGVSHLAVSSLHEYQGALVATGFNFDDFSTFAGSFTPPCGCRADFDGSGAVAVADIFAYLNAWFNGCTGQTGGSCNGANADTNGGGLSVSDIFDFLSLWFGGC